MSAPRLDRLTLFVHVWALASLCDAVRWIVSGVWWGWPLGAAALVAAWLPRRWTPIASMIGIQVAFVFVGQRPGWTPNHSFFIALVNLVFLGWTLSSAWRNSAVTRGSSEGRTIPGWRDVCGYR